MTRRIIKLIIVCLVVMFATNAYAGIIVYDGGGSQASIQGAMTELGYAYTLRGSSNAVTAADLAGAELLVIGWNAGGDMGGLSSSVLESGITGNILLTGQDADVHVVHGYDWTGGTTAQNTAVDAAATAFLDQAITFAQAMGGTGLVALGDFSGAFGYLPSGWGISATGGLTGETIHSFTAEGLASGVFDGLTPGDLSNWGESYHTDFQSWDPRFEVFAYHSSTAPVAVTIGHVVPVPAALLLGVLGLSVAGVKLRKFV